MLHEVMVNSLKMNGKIEILSRENIIKIIIKVTKRNFKAKKYSICRPEQGYTST